MKAVFLILACLVASANSLSAQALPATLKPQVGITVFCDGKPTNQQAGVKIGTREIRFNALLNTKSNDFFNDFQSELVIKNTEVILARNGRRLARVNIPDGHSLTNPAQQAQPADRVIFIFTLVAQRKNGELVPLPEQPAYTFPVRK